MGIVAASVCLSGSQGTANIAGLMVRAQLAFESLGVAAADEAADECAEAAVLADGVSLARGSYDAAVRERFRQARKVADRVLRICLSGQDERPASMLSTPKTSRSIVAAASLRSKILAAEFPVALRAQVRMGQARPRTRLGTVMRRGISLQHDVDDRASARLLEEARPCSRS
jgi:hypothetical protein